MAEGKPSLVGGEQEENALTKFLKTDFVPGKPYGHGGFGSVFSGKVGEKFVVAKILHSPIAEEKFTIIRHMNKFQHRSLVRFFGVFEQEQNACPHLIYKHANKGNLLSWLRNSKGQMDKKTLNKFTCDIINGMEYLHKANFVHGCLAARNILLDEYINTRSPDNKVYLNAQISDYGMTRVINGIGANYYKVDAATERTLPIRWMPKEAIIGSNDAPGEIILASDVWSFAVVVWEMWTRGDIPYGMTASNQEVLQNILDGKSPLTFHKPANCNEDVLSVMKNIFNVAENPDERPTFLDLQKSFDSLTGMGGNHPQKKQCFSQAGYNNKRAPNKNDKNEMRQRSNAQCTLNKDEKNKGKSGEGNMGVVNNCKRANSVPRNKLNHQQQISPRDPPPPYTPLMALGMDQVPLGMSQQMGIVTPGICLTAADPRYSNQQPLMTSSGMGMATGYPYAPHAVGATAMGAAGVYGLEAQTSTCRTASLEQELRDMQNKLTTLEIKQQVEHLGRQLKGQQRINTQNRERNNPQRIEKTNQGSREGAQDRNQQGGGRDAQDQNQQGGGRGAQDRDQQGGGRGPRRSRSGQQDERQKDEGCLNQ